MKTLWQPQDLAEIRARIARLPPDARPGWGKMDAGRMVVHLAQQLRIATGDLRCQARKTPLRWFPLKHLVFYVLPIPRGVPTAPELLERHPETWEADRAELDAVLDRFVARSPGGEWPSHPTFGTMTGKTWGVMAYKHMDHHLRQFGV